MTTAQRRAGRRAVAPTRPATGSQPRADRTRTAIIDETVRCVLAEGFAAASAKHIAERAGVTWGVIQYHFGDRDGLLMAVIDSGFAELQNTVSSVVVPNAPLRARLDLLVEASWSAFSAPASMASLEILVATRADRDTRVAEHLVDLARALEQLGRRIAGPMTGALDPSAIGDLVWASLRGLALAQMAVLEPIDSTRERAALVEILTAYLDPGGVVH